MLIMRVRKAREEAQRFLEKVTVLEREMLVRGLWEEDVRLRKPNWLLTRSMEGAKSAAVKRASLDLTMALAVMRKVD